MRVSLFAGACIAVASVAAAQPAGKYPVKLTATAEAVRGTTRATAILTISVDRLMLESRHTRVVDALKYGGYANALNTLRPLPVIGSIATDNKQVDLRYAWESIIEGKRRLVLISDKPLFFLGGGSDTQKAGYELTVVELIFDERGNATGTIAGAARVKPAPEAGVILGDYAETPVTLTIRAGTY